MNVELLEIVGQHILAEPRRFDMRFITLNPESLRAGERPPCGTVCCFSGWASALARPGVKLVFHPESWLGNGDGGYLMTEDGQTIGGEDGAKQLGISEDQADRLFYEYNWPQKYLRQYRSAKTPKGKARAGYRRIQHFIATDGKE